MKKILGLVASQRKLANGEILIKEADALILSAPCYALGPAAITKLFGDRIIALAQHIDELWGKPCVIIGTAGIKGWEGYTLSALIANSRFLGFDVKYDHMFLGALPGEALVNDNSIERISALLYTSPSPRD